MGTAVSTTQRAGAGNPVAPAFARVADRTLDAVLAALAAWTVVYHACLVLRVGAVPALGATAVLLGAAGVLVPRRGPAPAPACAVRPGPARAGGAWRLPVAAAGAVAAVAMATDAPWWLVVASWLVAAGGAVVAYRPRANAVLPDDSRAAGGDLGRWESPVVLAWTLALALLTLWIRRPNPDDLYYVNLSQWVATHGDFPLRDTLFGDLRWPMTSWPPVASYDALAGTVAHVLGLPAGTIVYEVVPPLATAAAVLALWRLLRTWRTPYLAWAFSAALVFLLLDGTSSYATPGNLFVTRMWQGKVILLCLVVPLALVHALRYVERPDRRGLGRLVVTGIAGVACSTTAMFLLPAVAAAGMVPLARRPRAAVAGFAALAGYPLAAATVTVALDGRSADDFGSRELYRFDPAWFGHAVFLTGPVALVGVLAVLVGPLVLAHPAARVTMAALALAVGATFVPGVTRVAYDLTGIGPTLWRLTWGCTVGALVGVGAVRAWLGLRRRCSLRTAVPLTVAAVAGYVVTAPPTLSPETNTSFATPPHWQRSPSSREAVAWMQRAVPGQGVVLATDALSITVSVTTTRLRPVAPREYYMAPLQDQPGFEYRRRLLLVRLANPDSSAGTPAPHPDATAVRRAVDRLDVAAACLDSGNATGLDLLHRAGFRDAYRVGDTYRCLLRTATD